MLLSQSTLHILSEDPTIQPSDKIQHVIILHLDLVQFYLNISCVSFTKIVNLVKSHKNATLIIPSCEGRLTVCMEIVKWTHNLSML